MISAFVAILVFPAISSGPIFFDSSFRDIGPACLSSNFFETSLAVTGSVSRAVAVKLLYKPPYWLRSQRSKVLIWEMSGGCRRFSIRSPT